MRTGDLYDFAPIADNCIHNKIVSLSIFATVDSIKSLNF